MSRFRSILYALAVLAICADAQADGEPWAGLRKWLQPLAEQSTPGLIDMGRNACRRTVEQLGIEPMALDAVAAAFPEGALDVFPGPVRAQVRLYFGVPLNDPQTAIGLANTLATSLMGGGSVLAMAFETDVYCFFQRGELAGNPALQAVVAHELVHVAQYQAFGYDGYKARYAADVAAGLDYHTIALEADAYRFDRGFPQITSRDFFAFYRSEGIDEAVAVDGPGGRTTVPLRTLVDIRQSLVEITVPGESFPRVTTLVLGADAPDSGHVPSQLLDPHGGPPLYVFEAASAELPKLLFNGPVHPGGVHIVAVAAGSQIHLVWRHLGAFVSQSIPGPARFEDVDGDQRLELVQDAPEPATWWWFQRGYYRYDSRDTGGRPGLDRAPGARPNTGPQPGESP